MTVLAFPTQDRRCKTCANWIMLHWTPGPCGWCEIETAETDRDYVCPQFRAAWPASQKEDVETGE